MWWSSQRRQNFVKKISSKGHTQYFVLGFNELVSLLCVSIISCVRCRRGVRAFLHRVRRRHREQKETKKWWREKTEKEKKAFVVFTTFISRRRRRLFSDDFHLFIFKPQATVCVPLRSSGRQSPRRDPSARPTRPRRWRDHRRRCRNPRRRKGEEGRRTRPGCAPGVRVVTITFVRVFVTV